MNIRRFRLLLIRKGLSLPSSLPSLPPSHPHRRTRVALTVCALLSLLLASCGPSDAPTENSASNEKSSTTATVKRIVDGDTLVASRDGRSEKIRLLSIDTPETKDPNKPVECMGPQAAAFLKSRLPVGSTISLKFDKQKRDKYGRVLAAVFDSHKRFIEADIARAGLGVAKTYKPNTHFYQKVLAAQEEARADGRGLFDDEKSCTLPAQVRDAVESLNDAATTSNSATTIATATAVSLTLNNAVSKATHLMQRLSSPPNGIIFTAITTHELRKLRGTLNKALGRANSSHQGLKKKMTQLRERKDERARAAARAAASDRARRANSTPTGGRSSETSPTKTTHRTPAPKPATPHKTAPIHRAPAPAHTSRPHSAPAPKPSSKHAPAPKPSTKHKSSDGKYPGYTGPRCYAPGGKTWKPCP